MQKELARYKDKKDIEKRQLPDGVTIEDASLTSVISLLQPQEDSRRSTDLERIRTSPTPFSMVDYFQSLESSIIQSRSPTPISEFGWLLSNIDFIAPRTTLSLVKSSNYQIAQVFRGLTFQVWKDMRPNIEWTIMLLPENTQRELREKSHDVVFFSLIMFLLVNNFVTENDVVFENLFQQLRQFTIPQMENLLDMVPYPYSAALEQSILTIAIKVGAINVVRVLLNRGLDPNVALCYIDNECYVPLHLACIHRQDKIVRLLIDSGADVNRSLGRSAIWHLFRKGVGRGREIHSLPHVTRDILSMLLIAGGGTISHDLETSVFWKDREMVDVFLAHAVPSTNADLHYVCHTPLMIALMLLDQDRAIRAARVLLGTEFESGKLDIGDSLMPQLQEAGQLAALQGNERLVDFFLRAGVQPTGIWMLEAVRGNSKSIIHRLIRDGVNVAKDVYRNCRTESSVILAYAGTLPNGVDLILRQHAIRHRFTTPIAEAIRWKRHELYQIFLDLGVLNKVNYRLAGLQTALIAASEIGDLVRVRYMLTTGRQTYSSYVRSHFPGSGAERAIELATIGNHEDIVSELLLAGCRPDTASITAAILVRNLKLLRLFLDIGTPIALNSNGYLSLAVRWGNIDAVHLLLEAGASRHEIGWHIPFLVIDRHIYNPFTTPLGEALARGDEKIIQLLLDSGASVSLERTVTSGHLKSPLRVAVESGHENVVRQLLSHGAEPYDSSALLAASLQSMKMLQILLDAFDSTYPTGKRFFGSIALRVAIQNCDTVKVRLLAKYTDVNDTEQRSGNVDPRESPWGQYDNILPSPLGEAIATCNAKIIELVLDAGGNPNNTVVIQTSYPHRGRWTALLAAVATKSMGTVELICNAGADINYAAHLGTARTPLQLAVEIGSLEIVKFLLSKGADVNALPCIWGGGTALQLAAIKGYVGIAELLIQHGADLNAPRGRYIGRTAFEGAAEHGRMDMLLLLYHNGVDLVSDGGEQVRRAMELAEGNAQLGAKGLVEQLSLSFDTTFVI